ncbi:hypothetical protein [Acetobacter cibinongensis]|uniref:hypothetical protein n=1 Tax=Acetobacter cibinongensis TaxID=146475 RepID=UPI000A3CE35E|nr:hypothetical protein [Acetobacter cibinongensis]
MKQALITGGKISGIITLVPLLLAQVPEPWDTLVCTIIIVCGALATVIPAPQPQSAWSALYKGIAFVGLNFGWAANHLAATQAKTAPHNAETPDADGKA